jgi:hypothetical protein
LRVIVKKSSGAEICNLKIITRQKLMSHDDLPDDLHDAHNGSWPFSIENN